ncbi:hypothetical protein K0M31_017588, partial [Melipona bicolor]
TADDLNLEKRFQMHNRPPVITSTEQKELLQRRLRKKLEVCSREVERKAVSSWNERTHRATAGLNEQITGLPSGPGPAKINKPEDAQRPR